MADKTFHLEIYTPDRCAVDGDMVSLNLKARDGRLGVLFNHAALIASLDSGKLICRDSAGKETVLAAGEGFLEVLHNQVQVLVGSAEFPGEIDKDRAKKAVERSKERLAHRSSAGLNVERAEAALRRAVTRLLVSDGSH